MIFKKKARRKEKIKKMKRKNLLLTLAMIPSMLLGIASVTSCSSATKYNAQNVITRRAPSLNIGNVSNYLKGVELTTFKKIGSTIILNLHSLPQCRISGQTLSLKISELKVAYNNFTSDDGILILKLDLPESFGSLSLESSINPNITTNLYAYKAITASTYYLALDINNIYSNGVSEYFNLLFTNEIDAKYASSFAITPMQNSNLTYTAFDNFIESYLTVENVIPVGEAVSLETVFTNNNSQKIVFNTDNIKVPASKEGLKVIQFISWCHFDQFRVEDGQDSNIKLINTERHPQGDASEDYYIYYLVYPSAVKSITLEPFHDGLSPADTFFDEADPEICKVTAVRATNFEYEDMIKDGGTKTIVIDVDSRYTEEQIIAQVKAVDLFGVDVPVTKVSSDYVIGQTGTFNIVISATDSYGQTAQATLICDVRDYAVPVITQKVSDIHYDYGTLLTEAKLLENFELSDNMGTEGLTTKFVYPSGFDINKALVFGKYALTLEVSDAFGNKATKAFTLNVVDNVAPVISKKSGQIGDKIKIAYSSINKNTINTILGYYSANDAIDGACDIYLKEGKIPAEMAGDFTLKIAAKDKSGNEAVYTVNCEIVADLPPVFILSDKLVNATVSNPLDLTDLQNIVQKAILRKSVRGLQINAVGYLATPDKEGSYPVSYTYYDDNNEAQSGAFTLEVIDDTKPVETKSNWFVDAFKAVFKDTKNATATQWVTVIASFVLVFGLVALIIYVAKKCKKESRKYSSSRRRNNSRRRW